MWINIPLLYILILIITFSHSQNEQENCSGDADSRNDCFAKSVSNGYCCFKLKSDLTSGECQLVEREALKSSQELDCGITEDNYGKYEFGQYHPKQDLDLGFETCGKSSPSKKEDCTDFSEISNSCCLFTKDGTKACLHIGRKYYGNSKESTFTLEGKGSITVECNSVNIIFNMYSFLLITLFL